MIFTKHDRQIQAEILHTLKELIVILQSKPLARQSKLTPRPAVLTEDQLDDIAEAAAKSNGKNIHYESE